MTQFHSKQSFLLKSISHLQNFMGETLRWWLTSFIFAYHNPSFTAEIWVPNGYLAICQVVRLSSIWTRFDGRTSEKVSFLQVDDQRNSNYSDSELIHQTATISVHSNGLLGEFFPFHRTTYLHSYSLQQASSSTTTRLSSRSEKELQKQFNEFAFTPTVYHNVSTLILLIQK